MEILARVCKTEQMNMQRLWARIFVVAGGLLWVFMAWGTQWAYRGTALSVALGYSAIVVVAIAAIFVVGMFYELIAAALLVAGAVALMVYGLFAGWEIGVWGVVVLFFVLPMVVAAVLYWAAARMQRICDLSE